MSKSHLEDLLWGKFFKIMFEGFLGYVIFSKSKLYATHPEGEGIQNLRYASVTSGRGSKNR